MGPAQKVGVGNGEGFCQVPESSHESHLNKKQPPSQTCRQKAPLCFQPGLCFREGCSRWDRQWQSCLKAGSAALVPPGHLFLLWALQCRGFVLNGIGASRIHLPKTRPQEQQQLWAPRVYSSLYLLFPPLTIEFHETGLISSVHRGRSASSRHSDVLRSLLFRFFFSPR